MNDDLVAFIAGPDGFGDVEGKTEIDGGWVFDGEADGVIEDGKFDIEGAAEWVGAIDALGALGALGALVVVGSFDPGALGVLLVNILLFLYVFLPFCTENVAWIKPNRVNRRMHL